MLRVRLARGGSKKRPFYTIVLTEATSPRDGRYIEKLGYYNPRAIEGETALHVVQDRIDYWDRIGAQASDPVKRLLKTLKKQKQIKQTDDDAVL